MSILVSWNGVKRMNTFDNTFDTISPTGALGIGIGASGILPPQPAVLLSITFYYRDLTTPESDPINRYITQDILYAALLPPPYSIAYSVPGVAGMKVSDITYLDGTNTYRTQNLIANSVNGHLLSQITFSAR